MELPTMQNLCLIKLQLRDQLITTPLRVPLTKSATIAATECPSTSAISSNAKTVAHTM